MIWVFSLFLEVTVAISWSKPPASTFFQVDLHCSSASCGRKNLGLFPQRQRRTVCVTEIIFKPAPWQNHTRALVEEVLLYLTNCTTIVLQFVNNVGFHMSKGSHTFLPESLEDLFRSAVLFCEWRWNHNTLMDQDQRPPLLCFIECESQ